MLYIRQYDGENESGKGFNISFMDWDEFKEIIISRTAAVKDLIEYDCIIGGIDFDMGYLCVINEYFNFLMLIFNFSSDTGNDNGQPGYGLNMENLPMFVHSFKTLKCYTYIWPPVDQASTVGSKWQLIQNLDIIAAKHRQTRPKSRLLTDGQPIHPDTVLKRTHSESGNHVIFPDSEQHKRTWKYLKCNSEVPRCKWFCQTFVRLLRTYGEWRVIIVGGSPAYTVHTQPSPRDTWKRTVVSSFWPLNRLQYVCSIIHYDN